MHQRGQAVLWQDALQQCKRLFEDGGHGGELYCGRGRDIQMNQSGMKTVEIGCAKRKPMLAAGVCFGHGTDNALDEAAWLVLQVLGEPLDGSFETGQAGYRASRRAYRSAARARLDTRQPLAYLLGEAWFCGLSFEVGPDAVLVPRSPLAELMLDGFRALGSAPAGAPGAGPVHRQRVHCHRHGPSTGRDWRWMPRTSAVMPCRSRPKTSPCTDSAARVSLHESDLFAGLPGRRYDLIVSNPPYVPRAVVVALPAGIPGGTRAGSGVRRDGLDIPLRILADAAGYLMRRRCADLRGGRQRVPALQDALPDGAVYLAGIRARRRAVSLQ